MVEHALSGDASLCEVGIVVDDARNPLASFVNRGLVASSTTFRDSRGCRAMLLFAEVGGL
ncbi:hypothetical protein RSSM_01985 [Rhodopirellula sallentina SM41]|uniref:Uncharacterized protein n=1 Tax=Rhodopirellula sallentina SM41 TaxID=1263870 RepID=M5U557_9BACT|nr:hypothetical protein RSSM_01985 [Rhodopirellula sallentina SM41]